jgi:hypothetical protein
MIENKGIFKTLRLLRRNIAIFAVKLLQSAILKSLNNKIFKLKEL